MTNSDVCVTIEYRYNDGTIEYRDHAHYGDDGACSMDTATLRLHLGMGHARCAHSYLDALLMGETLHIRSAHRCPLDEEYMDGVGEATDAR